MCLKQELSYRKQIARQLRTQFVEGFCDNPVTLKSRLTVTQGHWKRNCWVDHTRLSLLVELLDVEYYRDLETWARGHSRSLKLMPFDRPCDFLLVGHCKYSFILYHCRVFWRWIISWPWKRGQTRTSMEAGPNKSLKDKSSFSLKRGAEYRISVIETGAIRKLGCGFLFAFCSNYGRICSRLWDDQCQRMAWPWKPG